MSSTEPRKSSTCTCGEKSSEGKAPGRKKSKSKNGEFNPKPYTFRLQQPCQGPRARAPPFHVQLDHTIAVLWNLFHQPIKAPDVGHLQWAKHFLQRIRNNHGDMPTDVLLVVKAIEERMLKQYADLCGKESFKPPECCIEDGAKHCQAKQSITFSEMVKQQPEMVQQLFCAQPEFAESCSSHLACDCATSKDEMSKYLKRQRAERVRVIREELKRLQEIDDYMGKVGDKPLKPIDIDTSIINSKPSTTSTGAEDKQGGSSNEERAIALKAP